MNKYRRRQIGLVITIAVAVFAFIIYQNDNPANDSSFLGAADTKPRQLPPEYGDAQLAASALEELEVKGRAPKTGYSRAQFGSGWGSNAGCDTRNIILNRDLVNVLSDDRCRVISGILSDPYTGKIIQFKRGESTSASVQIDHVVALSDAWQKGAQGWSHGYRVEFANDPLNLLAVDGQSNQDKGDSDAASWLPPNKPFRCQYVARQISVKQHYSLWVTLAEKDSMKRVLDQCADQKIIIKN